MVWSVHINKCRLSFRCLLSTLVEFWEARAITLLREALVSENTADIFVLNDKPRMASIPEFDLRNRFVGTKHGIFFWWLSSAGTRERKLWCDCQSKKYYQSDTVKGILLLPAAVDMGLRAILEILKTDNFEEFKEEMGLKASILKDMVQSATQYMGD